VALIACERRILSPASDPRAPMWSSKSRRTPRSYKPTQRYWNGLLPNWCRMRYVTARLAPLRKLRPAPMAQLSRSESSTAALASSKRIGIKFSCHSSGSGIGLALSRGLVEAMSGNLRPEETPGGGLTMTISLPAVPADTMTSRKAAPQQASLATSQPKRRASDHDPRARRRR
jgi:hypothetical protein